MEKIGEVQATRQAASVCQVCDLARARGDNFCPKCGRRLKEQQPAPQRLDETPSEEFPGVSEGPLFSGTAPSTDEKGQAEMLSQPLPLHEHMPQCACGQVPPPGAGFCCGCGRSVSASLPHHVLEFRTTDGPSSQFVLRGEEAIIGKMDDCDLVLRADGYVSRRHARVYEANGGVLVEDLGSANGTFVRVRRPVRLEPGDEIIVGKTAIVLNAATS